MLGVDVEASMRVRTIRLPELLPVVLAAARDELERLLRMVGCFSTSCGDEAASRMFDVLAERESEGVRLRALEDIVEDPALVDSFSREAALVGRLVAVEVAWGWERFRLRRGSTSGLSSSTSARVRPSTALSRPL